MTPRQQLRTTFRASLGQPTTFTVADLVAASELRAESALKTLEGLLPLTTAEERHLFGDKNPVTDEELEAFRVALEAKVQAEHRQMFPSLNPPSIEIMRGPRYARIVSTDGPHHRSAYGFVDLENGDLLKAAGWKAPAKHARGNLRGADPLKGCNRHGMAYLR